MLCPTSSPAAFQHPTSFGLSKIEVVVFYRRAWKLLEEMQFDMQFDSIHILGPLDSLVGEN